VSPDGPRCSRARLAGAVFVACVVLSACGNAGDGTPVGAQPVAQPSVYVLPPPTSDPSVETATTAPPAAAYVRTFDGVVLPDPAVTPGFAFADVTALDTCDLHYSLGVRQPRFNDKVLAFAAYGVSIHDRDIFQVDHLIPISLGGSNDERNLWPQPYDDTAGAEQKDLIERQLRGLVCSDKMTLPDAQAAIAKDWWAAYQDYMGLPVDPGSEGLAPYTRPELVPGEVANGAPCDEEGAIGYTTDKHIRLTCTATDFGELLWQKRY
jgi:hypothetical protein